MNKVISSERIPIKLWLDDMEEGALKQAISILKKTLQERDKRTLKLVKELNMMIFRLEKRNPELERLIVELKDILLEQSKK